MSTEASTPETAAPTKHDYPRRGEVEAQESGANFSLVQLGPTRELDRYHVRTRAGTFQGKVFLKELLGLSAMEISYGLLPPETSFPFYHKHQQNEEVYLFLSGAGNFSVDERVTEIREGSVVRVAPDGVRCFRNTSAEPMLYVVVQAKQGSLEQWTAGDGVGIPGEVVWPAS
jgi:mannose-6-phosphate isomerase-like protein (cupin superfamily)